MSKVSINEKWSSNLAYAIGLITSDGCLSNDGRHIDFTSKDLEQIHNFMKCLDISYKIRTKNDGRNKLINYYSLQFSNVKFYRFLLSIGLIPNKSKTVNSLNIPDNYFKDFLRGLFDGDGYSISYWDKVFKTSFRLYMGFVSASFNNITWLSKKISNLYGINGGISVSSGKVYQLRFAKYSSIELIQTMYYKPNLTCLSRKKFKLNQSLCIIQEQLSGSAETGRQACLRSMCRKTWRSESSLPHK